MRVVVAIVVVLVAAGCGDMVGEDQTFVRPQGPGNWVLVDGIHSEKQNPYDYRLRRNNYDYQGMHGYARLFDHLDANGYPWSMIRWTEARERLSPAILEGFSVVFINLVSDDRPDFSHAELEALERWVADGGGLFVIADHTNVYYSSERINPLLEPMGIEVPFTTAVDHGPDRAIQGGAWLKIRDFRDHPVTDDVEAASFQTGAPLITDDGVAFTSAQAFGDFWIENPEDAGFYGNWTFDSGERSGTLPVVAATEYGEGRVVVVGDQNIFGDEWLYTANNFELAANSFEWLAGQSATTVEPLRQARGIGYVEVAIDLEKSNWNIGTNGCDGYFPFYINFNRTAEVRARGVLSYSGREDVLVFADPVAGFTDRELEAVHRYLDSGKTVVLLTDVTRANEGTIALLGHLAPAMTVDAVRELAIADLPAPQLVETVSADGPGWLVSSPHFDVEGLRLAGHAYEGGLACSRDIERSTSYIRLVTSSFGEPLITAQVDGSTVDIARMASVGPGRLIVFLQDGFWRNETLGSERQPPTSRNRDAHEVEYRFIDWLIATTP